MAKVVGIDLGTTNSVVAAIEGGQDVRSCRHARRGSHQAQRDSQGGQAPRLPPACGRRPTPAAAPSRRTSRRCPRAGCRAAAAAPRRPGLDPPSTPYPRWRRRRRTTG